MIDNYLYREIVTYPVYVELSRRLINRSKKDHRCTLGHHTIRAGTTYERLVYVEDGAFKSTATCLDCIQGLYE